MKGVERPSRPTTWRFPLSHPKKGPVVVMDNLRIEQAFFTWEKKTLCKAQARMHEALVEARGVLEVISRKDTIGWFGHCATR